MSWKKNYLTALLAEPPGRGVVGVTRFYKYRNIAKSKRSEFETFVRKQLPGVKYINYYERADKSFTERVYL